MVPLWFTLSALCFVGAAVLLYVDIDRRRGLGRRRKSWAKSHGFDYEHESADILKRWKRGVMSTVGDITAKNVVLGQIRGEAVFIFDLEDVATVIALHRKVGTNVVVDLRLKGIKEPRENDIWLLGAIGPRMVYSTNLDAARRACDRRMVTFAHTAPDCAEIMWNEQNWTLVQHAGHQHHGPSGTKACAPCASSTTCCGCCRRSRRPSRARPSRVAVARRAARSRRRPPAPSRRPAGPTCRRAARMSPARPPRSRPLRTAPRGRPRRTGAPPAATVAQRPAVSALSAVSNSLGHATPRRSDHRTDVRAGRGIRPPLRHRRLRPGAGRPRRRRGWSASPPNCTTRPAPASRCSSPTWPPRPTARRWPTGWPPGCGCW